MSTNQPRSDMDDRTSTGLSTSSHTHVDFTDSHQQSPRSKMVASAKRAEEAEVALPGS